MPSALPLLPPQPLQQMTAPTHTVQQVLLDCPFCHSKFKFGYGQYRGHKLNRYGGIFCCDSCWDSNWDGWAPHHEAVLIKQCDEKGILLPDRNDKGLLPRD